MKKILSFVFLCSIFFYSCTNFTLPKKVSLKTNADYNFTVAKIEEDLGESFSIGKMISDFNSNDGIKIYDYNPDNSSILQNLLLEFDLKRIELDAIADFTNIDLSELIKDASVQESFSIPKIKLEETVTGIDLSELNDIINKGITFIGETKINQSQIVKFAFENEEMSCDSIKYKTGSLIVNIIGECPDGTGVLIREVGASEPIVSTTVLENKAIFDLENISFPVGKEIEILFEGSTESNINYVGQISEESKIFSVEGLTISEPTDLIKIGQINIEAVDTSIIEEGTIGKGEINFSFDFKNWEGVEVSKIELLCNGGLNKTFDDCLLDSSLDGIKYVNEDIVLEINPFISIENASILFEENVVIGYALEISSFSEVLLSEEALDTTFETNIQESMADIYEMGIRNVVWGKSGIVLECKNNLPMAGEFEISLESNFFDIHKTENVSFGSEKNFEWTCEENLSTDIEENSIVDMKASVVLQSEDGKIKLNNIEMDKEYTFEIKVKPIFDWVSISLDSSRFSMKSEEPIDTGINLKSITKALDETIPDFSSSVEFPNVMLYMFCDIPNNLFDNPKLNGDIKINLGDTELALWNKEDDLFKAGPKPKLEKTKIVSSNEGEEEKFYYLVTTDIAKKSKQSVDLSELLNSNTDDTLKITYDISFTTGNSEEGLIEINKESLESASTQSIGFSAFVTLPLKMKIEENLEIDVMEMLTSEESEEENVDEDSSYFDLFGREEGETLELEELEAVLDLVEKVAIEYKPTNLPFTSNNDINLVIDLDGNGSVFSEKTLSLSGGRLNIENPKQLLEIPAPLVPSVKIVLPEGEFGLKRDMMLKTNISVGITTNGTVELWEMSENEEN